MGLFKHTKSNKTPLYEAPIYRRLENLFEDSGEISKLEDRIKTTEGVYQRLLIQELFRKDFLRLFTIMCELAFQNWLPNLENIDEDNCLLDTIRSMIGYVIGDIIFESTDIPTLNRILKNLEETNRADFDIWINNRKNGKVWITEPIDQIIEDVVKNNLKEADIEKIPAEWRMTYEEAAKYDFSLFSRISVTEVETMLSAREFSQTYLTNILYGLVMLRLLIDAFEDEKVDFGFYLTWLGDEDLFIGTSGVQRFFDGIVTLEKADKDNPWLLKCISTYYNPLEAIESIDAKLDDIEMDKCILFIPLYPSSNALRYSVYTYEEKRHEILILYRHDLYQMIGMDDAEIKEYLKNKRIK